MSSNKVEYIKFIYPDAITIEQPCICGCVHELYITTCKNGEKVVFRFSTQETAEHNQQVSKALYDLGIKAPAITIYNFGFDYCEVYPFIPGKTLYERIQEGIPMQKLDTIYHDVVKVLYKISTSELNISDKNNYKAKETSIAGKFVHNYFKFINKGKTIISHSDLHSKNILLDNNDNFYAILDLDAVEPTYISSAILLLINDAQRHGYDISKFEHIIPNLYDRQKNTISVNTQLQIYSCIRTLYRFVRKVRNYLR